MGGREKAGGNNEKRRARGNGEGKVRWEERRGKGGRERRGGRRQGGVKREGKKAEGCGGSKVERRESGRGKEKG